MNRSFVGGLLLLTLSTVAILNAQPAQATGATVTQTVAAGFYNCTKASAWTRVPRNWNIASPYKDETGRYYVYATTGKGVFQLGLKPGTKSALLQPADATSRRIWKIMGCPSSYQVKVWYVAVDAYFNGGGALD